MPFLTQESRKEQQSKPELQRKLQEIHMFSYVVSFSFSSKYFVISIVIFSFMLTKNVFQSFKTYGLLFSYVLT